MHDSLEGLLRMLLKTNKKQSDWLKLNHSFQISLVQENLMNLVFADTPYPFSHGYFQYDNFPCQKTKVMSNWSHEDDMFSKL